MSGSAGGSVIDALVVTLGLNASKFTEGEKEALGGYERIKAGAAGVDDAGKKAEQSQQQRDQRRRGENDRQTRENTKKRDDAARTARDDQDRTEKTARVDQEAAKRRKEAWSGAKEAALGFAAAIGGIAAADYIKNTAQDVAATGRLAHNLDMSTASVTAWGNAIEASVGGNAQAAIATLGTLSDALIKLQTQGDGSGIIPMVAQLEKFSGNRIDIKGKDGKFVGPEELIKRISGATQGMDPRLLSSILSQYGFDQGTINEIERGPEQIDKDLEEAKKRGVPDDKEAKEDAKLAAEAAKLEQAFKRLGQVIVLSIAPDITRFLADISSLFSLLSGKTTWDDFKKERAKHWHDAQVDILVGRGESPADAEAHVRDAEAKGRDATADQTPPDQAKPGIIKRVERFLGMPAGLDQSPALPADIEAEVRKDAVAQGVDPDHMVALFRAEHGGYKNVSSAGAFGPAQLMPGTAALENVATSPSAANYDWRENVAAGVRYWAGLRDRFHGNTQGADAGYNAGPAGKGVANFVASGDRSGLPAETNHYVDQIAANMAPAPPAGSASAGGDTNTSSVTIGKVEVHTAATDTDAIVRDMNKTLQAHPLMVQANSGLE